MAMDTVVMDMKSFPHLDTHEKVFWIDQIWSVSNKSLRQYSTLAELSARIVICDHVHNLILFKFMHLYLNEIRLLGESKKMSISNKGAFLTNGHFFWLTL